MKRLLLPLLGVTALIGAASAHHAFSAVFTADKMVTVTGVLTKVEWVNPHVYFYVEGKTSADSPSKEWMIESHPPMALRRAGLPRDMLVVGQPVTVDAYPARNGEPVAFAQAVKFADGKTVRIMLDPKDASQ